MKEMGAGAAKCACHPALLPDDNVDENFIS